MDDFTPNGTDRRLADALRERLSAAHGACPDAERLAAWSDGALNTAETAALEAHLADCARCQAVVSAFAATDEIEPAAAAPATVIPFHRRPVMKWALPLAASLAASLVVWNVVRDVTPSPADVPAESTQAVAAPDAAALPTPLAPSPAAVQPAAPTTNQAAERRVAKQDMAKASADQKAERSAAARELQASGLVPPPPPPPAFAPPPSPKPASADARASTITGLPQSTLNVTIDGVSARPPARQDAGETVMLDAKPIAQFASASALFRATADSAARTAQSAVAGGVGQAGAARAGGGRGGGGGGGGAAGRGGTGAVSASAAVEVALKQETDDPLTHWRILAGNRVERSRDNGLTWSAITLEAGLPAITNGAAPSGQICWLVGARGLVLVSRDAATFTRVTAPTDADLISIRATDALNASVTAADGRTFTTTDGGKMWKGPGLGD